MSLLKLERLIQSAHHILEGDSGDGLDVAREIALAGKTLQQRLQQINLLISRGEILQALELAEDSPAIQDSLRLFGFSQANEWRKMCRSKGWPLPEEPDENMVLQLNEAYQVAERGRAGQSGLVEAYRGKMLKGDRLAAVSLLKAHLRRSPSDTWAQGELRNVEEAEARNQYQKLQKYLQTGDEAQIVQQMDSLDNNGFGRPEEEIYICGGNIRHSFRRKEVEADTKEALVRLQDWKTGDHWKEAVQYLDDLRRRAREFSVVLPQQGEFAELVRWIDGRRGSEERKAQILELEARVRAGLARLEEERGRQVKKSRAELVENLADLDRWERQATELAHRWESSLEQRLHRELSLLREDDRAATRKRQVAIGSLIALIAGALLAAGAMIFQKSTEDRAREVIGKLIREREVKAAEQFLEQRTKDLQGVLLAEKEKLAAFLEREKAARKRLGDDLKTFDQILKNPTRSWSDEYRLMERLKKAAAELPKDFQGELKNELLKLEDDWKKAADEEKKKREEAEERKLGEIEKEIDGIEAAHGAAVARLGALEGRLDTLADERSSVIEPIRSPETVNLKIQKIRGVLDQKVKMASEIEGFNKRLLEAARKGDVEEFQKELNKMAESIEVPAELAEKARDASRLEKNPEILLSRLWMPYGPETEKNTFSSEALGYLPSGLPLPKEKEAARRLLNDFMDELYEYPVPDSMDKILVRGKIKNSTTEGQKIWAFNIIVYEPETGKFEKRPKQQILVSRSLQNEGEPEAMFKFLKESKISEFAKKIDEEENYPRVFQPILAEFFDQLFSENSLDSLGRGYVAKCLKDLSEGGMRPAQFGLQYSPSLQRKINELAKLPEVKEGEWLKPDKKKDLTKAKAYQAFFDITSGQPSFVKETNFLSSLTKGQSLTLVALVDEAGMCPELGSGVFLVPQEGGIKVFRGQRHGLIPFCPIYRLEKNPQEVIERARSKAGLSPEEAALLVKNNLPALSVQGSQ
jgi:hypothetical protein